MKRMMGAAALLVLAALLAVVPATEAKPQKPKNEPTKLTLRVEFPSTVDGKAKSAKKCRGNRKIELYAFTFGPDGGAMKIGQTKSERSGNYAFEGVMIDPTAEYETVTFPVKRGKTKCGGANSPRVTPSGGPIQMP